MNKRKSIMIDMDDVIVSGGFLFLINEFLGTNYIESDFKSFYMQDKIPNKDDFFDWFKTKNLYEYATLNNDVVDVIRELNEYYDVFIGTSFIFKEIMNESGYILEQKYNFLIKHFPFLNPYNFIFLGNKNILKCDIKIDDRIDNLKGAKTKILYTAYHNKDISDKELMKKKIIRANNWNDIKNILVSK